MAASPRGCVRAAVFVNVHGVEGRRAMGRRRKRRKRRSGQVRPYVSNVETMQTHLVHTDMNAFLCTHTRTFRQTHTHTRVYTHTHKDTFFSLVSFEFKINVKNRPTFHRNSLTNTPCHICISAPLSLACSPSLWVRLNQGGSAVDWH